MCEPRIPAFAVVALCLLGVGVLRGAGGVNLPEPLEYAVSVSPGQTVAAGAVARVTVRVLNPGPVAVDAVFPAELPLVVLGTGATTQVRAVRAATTSAAPVTVPPGAFRSGEYTLVSPFALTPGAWTACPAAASPPAVPSVAARLPAAAGAESAPQQKTSPGLPRLFSPLLPYEPMYFAVGSTPPSVEFQLSLKYHLPLLDPSAVAPGGTRPWGDWHEWIAGLHFGYTQTSQWDIKAPSAPFYDTSYRPGVFTLCEHLETLGLPGLERLDFQAGYEHESNGQGGERSRSLNMLYVKPSFYFLGDPDEGRLYLKVAPRVWHYVMSLSDNRDMDEYRGYADLTLALGKPGVAELSALLRAGDALNHSSARLGLTIPCRVVTELLNGTRGTARQESAPPSLFFLVQYFAGYGPALVDYRTRDETVRVGLCIVP